jgi:AcrR family transcriptional regulator
MAESKRDHLIDAALELFCRHGFHATGIDQILAEAGVAKMTLYKHFKSKDELILAALRRRDEKDRNWFMRAVERRAKSPKQRLLAVFDAIDDWLTEKDFTGCVYIGAAHEFADPKNPIHAAAAEHKLLVLDYVRGLAKAAGAADPDDLAYKLILLVEGATVMAQVCGHKTASRQAKDSARKLLADAGL